MRRMLKASGGDDVRGGAAESEIQTAIQALNSWLPTASHARGVMLFPDYSPPCTNTRPRPSGLKQQSGSCSSRLPGHKGNSSY